jgi:hypothetical protein
MDELTWKCEACKEIRPDARISVYAVDISDIWGLAKGAGMRNINHCNDRPDCIVKAKKIADDDADRMRKTHKENLARGKG